MVIAFFGFSVVVDSFKHVLAGAHFTPMAALVKPYRLFEGSTSVLFFFRWVVLPLYQVPSIYTLLSIAPMFMVGGYYLAFFFIISHNFESVYLFDKDNCKDDNKSFLYKQVSSSSNVGGPLLCFFNGGLNYQIEHHLFPRMSHAHYPKIAPFVREFCKKKNIPYVHFPTIAANVLSCSKHLAIMGAKKEPKLNYEN